MVIRVDVVDENGNPISTKVKDIDVNVKDYHITLTIENNFTKSELLTLSYLLANAIDYGGGVEEIRNYIELFDKINKIINQNDCK